LFSSIHTHTIHKVSKRVLKHLPPCIESKLRLATLMVYSSAFL
jgi:hypothetical protein